MAIFRPHLGTSQPAESVKFWCALFGWTFTVKGRRASTASLCRGSQEVATCVAPVAELEGPAGGCYPAFWVESLAQRCALASELGARVVTRDDTGENPTAVIVAPTGEVCALIEGSRGTPGRTDPEDAWLEVVTPDPSATGRFYEKLLGWERTPRGDRYSLLTSSGQRFAGLSELHDDWSDRAFLSATGRTGAAEKSIPPHWMVYFRVRTLGDVLARVEFLGGTVMTRHEILPDLAPAALIQDPAGHFWSIVGS
jgi:uncharacterized protein